MNGAAAGGSAGTTSGPRNDPGGSTARELTEVAPGVWTATADLWTSLTTVVVGADGSCLVVDPGITVAEVAALARAISDRGWTVAAGFSTHPHWDHLLWSPALGEGPRWATRRGAEHAVATRPDSLTKAAAAAPGHDENLFGRVTALPDDAGEIPWDGPRVVVVRHGAHCPGHAGLVVPHARALLAGDMLSDLEIPLTEVDGTDPVNDYLAGMDALESAAREHAVRVLIPGHGHVGDADELSRRLRADRAYLDDLVAIRTSTDPRLLTP